jgi:hypothetical protein
MQIDSLLEPQKYK